MEPIIDVATDKITALRKAAAHLLDAAQKLERGEDKDTQTAVDNAVGNALDALWNESFT